MTDEKKLPDETAEDVAGGTIQNREEYYRFREHIMVHNCSHCLKHRKDCPFHDDLEEAYEAMGNVSTCSYWRPTRHFT